MTATRKRPGRPVNKQQRERRREEILDAAAKIFAEHGYPRTDLQIVADELGLGKGTLYLYFPSKQDLFLAAADRGMQRLRNTVDEAIAGLDDHLERMEHAIRAYLTFFKDHAEYAELLIQERAEFRDRKKSTYFVQRDANKCKWVEAYEALIRDKRVRDVPVSRLLDVTSDLVYGTMFTNHFSGRHKPVEEQARDILDVVFNGILTLPERRRRASRKKREPL